MTARRLLLAALAVAVLALAGLGLARSVAEAPPRTPETVAQEVAESLRCPTCQGLSVAESDARMAEGMRVIIREQAEAGTSPEQIRGYFVARYGEWILLSPPRRGLNWLLWTLPVLTVAVGAGLAVWATRRRPVSVPAVGQRQLTHAAAVYRDHLAGCYTPEDSPAGERVEAALELLASLDEDPPADLPEAERGRRQALRLLAAALPPAGRPG